jgi:hypothetical protein
MFRFKKLNPAAMLLSLSVFLLLSCSDSSTDPDDKSNDGRTASCKRTPLPPPSGPIVVVNPAVNINDVIANATGNTTVLFEDGTYTLDRTLVIDGDNIAMRSASGNRGSVVLRGHGLAGSVTDIFMVLGDGFVVADMTIGWVSDHAINFLGNTDNHIVHNVRFVDTGKPMLMVTPEPPDTAHANNGLVEWCTFEYEAGGREIGPCGTTSSNTFAAPATWLDTRFTSGRNRAVR